MSKKIYISISEELNNKIETLAKDKKISKSSLCNYYISNAIFYESQLIDKLNSINLNTQKTS